MEEGGWRMERVEEGGWRDVKGGEWTRSHPGLRMR